MAYITRLGSRISNPSEAAVAEHLESQGLDVINSGWPDLLAIDPSTGLLEFVEVKGPGDLVRPNQKILLKALKRAGLSVRIARPKKGTVAEAGQHYAILADRHFKKDRRKIVAHAVDQLPHDAVVHTTSRHYPGRYVIGCATHRKLAVHDHAGMPQRNIASKATTAICFVNNYAKPQGSDTAAEKWAVTLAENLCARTNRPYRVWTYDTFGHYIQRLSKDLSPA